MIAFLFPGQGSQYVGMGKELAAAYPVAKQTLDEADEALGLRLSRICWEGPEDQLKLTENTQPAILAVSVAAFRVLQEKGCGCQFAAGHSLGEYSAHVAAGTLEFADAVRTVRNRGRYMQEAVPPGEGAMAALLAVGLDEAALNEICREAAAGEVVQPGNLNSPGQTVISGHKGAVERAVELARRRGVKRAVLLPVSAPFHCALMQPAQDRLAHDLRAIPFRHPRFPVVKNIDAEMVTAGDLAREALIRQVTGAVQWQKSMLTLISAGAGVFVEVGPGTVLCGLMRQIDRGKNCLPAGDQASILEAAKFFTIENREVSQ
jgi:[acyl-carrier-protein] S-malonyltransferase